MCVIMIDETHVPCWGRGWLEYKGLPPIDPADEVDIKETS